MRRNASVGASVRTERSSSSAGTDGGCEDFDDGAILFRDPAVHPAEKRIEQARPGKIADGDDRQARVRVVLGQADRQEPKQASGRIDEKLHRVGETIIQTPVPFLAIDRTRDPPAIGLLRPGHVQPLSDQRQEAAPDRPAMNERQMRRVEHVFHDPGPMDPPARRLSAEGHAGLIERFDPLRLAFGLQAGMEPEEALHFADRQRGRAEIRQLGVGIPGDMAIFAAAVERPAVEGTDDLAAFDLAQRERHAAMGAAIEQRGRPSVTIPEKDDWLAGDPERQRLVTQVPAQADDRPDPCEILEHGLPLGFIAAPGLRALPPSLPFPDTRRSRGPMTGRGTRPPHRGPVRSSRRVGARNLRPAAHIRASPRLFSRPWCATRRRI